MKCWRVVRDVKAITAANIDMPTSLCCSALVWFRWQKKR